MLHRCHLVEPVYPLTAGLSPKVLARGIQEALAKAPDMPEWIDPPVLEKYDLPSHRQALQVLHNPQDPSDIALDHPARQRLAYDEFLAGQLALALVRLKTRRLSGRKLEGDGHLMAKIIAALPYSLTNSQSQAIKEIIADLREPDRMLRLLQGDVGSGKTVVGLLAMAHAAEAGGQSALMVPTEVLARQHFATIAPLGREGRIAYGAAHGTRKGP